MPVKGEKMEYSVRAAHAYCENNKEGLWKIPFAVAFIVLKFFLPPKLKNG